MVTKRSVITSLITVIALATTMATPLVSAQSLLPASEIVGTSENNMIKVDWRPLDGLGTSFDKYMVMFAKGSYTIMPENPAKSYISWDYYNLAGLEVGETWSFQIVAVKSENGGYTVVGNRSNVIAVAVRGRANTTEAPVTSTSIGPVSLSAKIVPGGIHLDWEALRGLGTVFDKYNVIWKKGSYTSFDDMKGAAYINWDYYNLEGLEPGETYSFQVVPVKLINGEYVEVGRRSEIIRAIAGAGVSARMGVPAITRPTENAVLRNFPRYADLAWTEVRGAESYQIEITCDICGSGDKRWQNPAYYTTRGTSYTTPALAGDNEFRFRVRALSSSNATGEWSDFRYFRYSTPAEPTSTNANVITPAPTLNNVNSVPATSWAPINRGEGVRAHETSCGDSSGDDGLYSACKGDTIDHEPSGVSAKVTKYNRKYVKLSLDTANKNNIVVKLGKSYTVIADTDTKVTYTYTEWSPKFGAFVKITSVE